MTNRSLASSYLLKARKRLLVLQLLQREEAYSDVVREYRDRFPALLAGELDRLVAVSTWLRKERESSWYGDIDSIPTEQYGPEARRSALDDATYVLAVVTRMIDTPADP